MIFVVDLWLDGVSEDEEGPEMEKACLEFIEEQLDMTASQVKVRRLQDDFKKEMEEWLKLN